MDFEFGNIRDMFSDKDVEIDLMEHADADDNRLFSEGKKPRRKTFAQQVKNKAKKDARYAKHVRNSLDFIEALFNGDVDQPYRKLQFALTTSDFSTLFSDVMDRMMTQGYDRYPKTYRTFLKTSTVSDFRNVTRFNMYGNSAGLTLVPQLGDYPAGDRSLRSYSFAVAKYGKRYALAWELLVNDDMDAFRDFPIVLGEDAAMSEMQFATSIYAANATVFTVGHANKGTGAIDVTKIEAGINAMMALTAEDGKPIMTMPKYIVVPPQQYATVRKLLYPNLYPQATSDVNILPEYDLQIIIDPFLPIVDTVQGTTGWYLFAEPGPRSYVAEIAFLKGHEEPQVFEKLSNARSLSGGALVPEASFENDELGYKVRHVYGGSHANALGFWRYGYFGTGA